MKKPIHVPAAPTLHNSSLTPHPFRRHRPLLTLATLLTLLTLPITGCQMLTYTSSTGESFTRASLGANTSLSSLSVEAGTNGVRRVEMRGYQNDGTQALGAVTDAAVKAAIQSAKP
jgi:hypothetical protein